ncbi:MAG: GH116 family glycosyl hydrolase [Bacteroidota bacterium]|nr:GH116 family glycosyl hydrolase [Bacteroidota bacterium]
MTIDRKKYDDDKAEAEKFCAATGIDKEHYDGALGSMTLMAVSGNGQGIASWGDIEALHKNWLNSNQLSGPELAGPSEQGKTYNGALSVPFTLKPSESKTVTFILTWYFPNALNGLKDGIWEFKGNMYSNWWKDSDDVAKYVKDNLKDLSAKTHLYRDTFYKSNLPHWLLDRISSLVATLDSRTFFWSQDGYLGSWEGCNTDSGCCQGNCSHVYHYAQSHAYLFPSLARKMREQVFSKQYDDGRLSNRNGYDDIALDGMCGDILGAYREYLMCDSNDWINANWQHMRKAMDYIVRRWDSDEDGVMSGLQWDTLDSAMSGNSPWLGSLYLSALEASEKIAQLQHDQALAERYKAIRVSGAQKQNERLWNGQYYIQIPEANLPAFNSITGCNIDQVLGEWWGNQLGFESHYPADRIRSSMNSLLRYNFRCNFVGIGMTQRRYVADQDAGLQMTCWPNKGDRPVMPTPAADEAMTGFEYSAAATMVQFGMLKEGLMVTKSLYDRYDGRLRDDLTDMAGANWGYSGNPFGDDECGKFYGRALSVWSMLSACQGHYYNGPEKIIGFDPQWQPEDHSSFFTAAQGWGSFEQKRSSASQTDVITVVYGKLDIAEVRLAVAQDRKVSSSNIKLSGKSVSVELVQDADKVVLKFKEPVTIDADEALKITLNLN